MSRYFNPDGVDLAGLHADGRRGLLGWLLLVADAVWSLLGLGIL